MTKQKQIWGGGGVEPFALKKSSKQTGGGGPRAGFEFKANGCKNCSLRYVRTYVRTYVGLQHVGH